MSGNVLRLIQDASSGQLMILVVFKKIDLWPDVEVIGGSWKRRHSQMEVQLIWLNCFNILIIYLDEWQLT